MSHDVDEMEVVVGVKRFLQSEVVPRVAEIEAGDEFPQDILDKMAELGLFGMPVPEEYGGINLSLAEYVAIMEELAAGWSSLPSFLNSHCTVARILTLYGTEAQKQNFLPRLADGTGRGAVSLTEPGAGSDLKSIRTTARENADGSYTLNGDKVFITNGMRAGLHLVLARTIPADNASASESNISLFMLERDTPGFELTRLIDKMAFHHVDTAELRFENVQLPKESLVGGVIGKGLPQLLSVLEIGRLAMAGSAVGLARAALDTALRYSQDRQAFGVPICKHQAIQIHLANMGTELTAARCLVREAVRQKEKLGRADMMASMAKLFATEAGLNITREAMRVLGGYGYVAEFPAERFYREAPLYMLTEGSNEIQRNIIARGMLANDGPALLGLV
jgi:alkylation response protein AidB-like acyl-CoA dehydrogenase